MALTWILNRRIDINVKEELEAFEWRSERWVDDRLICCSPFRNDSRPSFFVNLDNIGDKEIAGTWLDSGAGSNDKRSGNFIDLLAFLRRETIEETFEYLIEKYDFKAYKTDLNLNISLNLPTEFKPLSRPAGELDKTYLISRGISPEVIKEADVFVKDNNVAFQWKNIQGEILAIKYRNTKDKFFFYEQGGKRLNETLYNIDYVTKNKCKTICITEAEIDTLSLQTLGRGSVALGSANFSDKQASLLLRTGAENIIIATDNDAVGNATALKIYDKLKNYFTIYRLILPNDCKDVNDFLVKYPNQKLNLRKYENVQISTKLELKPLLLK